MLFHACLPCLPLLPLLLQLREAAWLAAGQHGFAAVAGLPELRQIVQRCCMGAVDLASSLVKIQALSTDKGFCALLEGNPPLLLQHLVPQLRVCLLADVAAGLLVPGSAMRLG
jgi:hypothetical protein